MVDRLVNSEANARRIATVENCFGTSGQPLAIQGRVLVGEGVLTKMCRKKSKPRQFFLFNDILVYGNIVMDKKKYNKQHIIPLEEVKLENLEDDGINKNGWLIRTPTKSFAVYAATATEKTEWMAHINRCVDDLLRKTGKKPTLEHAAVWIPDAEASICMHCRKTQFTVLNRRHHCRKCGAVVCNPCSSKKFLLPAQSSKPLRVCISCYDTLTKAREKGGLGPIKTSDKPTNIESSGEDDSEDDVDEGSKGGDDKFPSRPIDEKPTFYQDATEDPLEAGQVYKPFPVQEVAPPGAERELSPDSKLEEMGSDIDHLSLRTEWVSLSPTGTIDNFSEYGSPSPPETILESISERGSLSPPEAILSDSDIGSPSPSERKVSKLHVYDPYSGGDVSSPQKVSVYSERVSSAKSEISVVDKEHISELDVIKNVSTTSVVSSADSFHSAKSHLE